MELRNLFIATLVNNINWLRGLDSFEPVGNFSYCWSYCTYISWKIEESVVYYYLPFNCEDIGDANFWHMGAMHPINAKIRGNFKYWKNIQILLETKDDQVLYSYKKVWAWNDFYGILGKKDKFMTNKAWIVHGHGFAWFCLFTQDTMIAISLRNVCIQLQYLIIFGSQKDLNIFLTSFKITMNCFSCTGCLAPMSIDVFSGYWHLHYISSFGGPVVVFG